MSGTYEARCQLVLSISNASYYSCCTDSAGGAESMMRYDCLSGAYPAVCERPDTELLQIVVLTASA